MLLVDVYNVLHTTGVLPPDLAGIEVADLAKLIQSSRYTRLEIILVCDGTGGGAMNRGIDPYRQTGGSGVRRSHPGVRNGRYARRGTVSVVYAGKGMEADSIIEVMIRGGGRFGNISSGAYGKAIVVSSDRRVRSAAKRARAKSLLSEDFLQHLADDWKRPGSFTAGAGGGGASHQPRPGADDRPGFARKTPLDKYTVEEWLREFGFGTTGPTQEDWDAMLADLHGTSQKIDDSDVPYKQPQPQTTTDPSSATPPSRPSPAPKNSSNPPTNVDPLTRAAMQEWPGRVNPEDLDMEKWLEGDERLQE